MSSRLPPQKQEVPPPQTHSAKVSPLIWCLTWVAKLNGAIAFYTCIPLPYHWPMSFDGIACLAPMVGTLIGVSLAALHWLLIVAGVPELTRSVAIVLIWLAITGGLHLDGAMDTADGLAVQNPERRLQVMSDSHTGAFGAMAGFAVLMLKVAALSNLPLTTSLALVMVPGWGRWGQLVAIARYPYLKATGKGAFHKQSIKSFRAVIPSFVWLIALSGLFMAWDVYLWRVAVGAALAGFTLSILTGAWFNHQLGGHTGDTYGAVVEWTEALLLCALTVF